MGRTRRCSCCSCCACCSCPVCDLLRSTVLHCATLHGNEQSKPHFQRALRARLHFRTPKYRACYQVSPPACHRAAAPPESTAPPACHLTMLRILQMHPEPGISHMPSRLRHITIGTVCDTSVAGQLPRQLHGTYRCQGANRTAYVSSCPLCHTRTNQDSASPHDHEHFNEGCMRTQPHLHQQPQ